MANNSKGFLTMSNLLQNAILPNSTPKNTHILDTLEHLDHVQCLQGLQPKKDTLKQKAKNSYFSKALAKKLMQLDSKLHQPYKRTHYDCCKLLVQERNKLTSRYCKARWCNVCNRIRTAHLMNGYLKPLQALENPYFVTLTIPNVKEADLRHSIREMVSTSRNIIRCFKRHKMAINGIRKTECTYNECTDLFHPHFHYLIDGKENAQLLIDEWLLRNPNCDWQAQHYVKADVNSLKELFKYQCKIVTKTKNKGYAIYIKPLDIIFNAFKGMRTFQSFGNIKKVNEDITEIQTEIYNNIPQYEFALLKWEKHDWQNMGNGEMLTNYKPSKKMIELTTTKMII